VNYITVEVEINHGQIVPSEPDKLPENGKGLLTILESTGENNGAKKMTPLEALEALQKHLNLDEAKAKAWMDTVKNARR
jgi:hypothetical protein